MTDKALEAALPGEAEVVAFMHPTANWAHVQYSEIDMHCPKDGPRPIPLVTLASLQAMQARAEKAERELAAATSPEYLGIALEKVGVVDAEWQARAEAAEARVKVLEEALNLIDALDPEEHLFGVSHDACRGLIARMGETARTALTGGSNG